MPIDLNAFQHFSASVINYAQFEFLPSLLAGDIFALSIAAVILLFLLIFVFKVAAWIISLIKRLFLLAIIVVAAYFFFQRFGSELTPEKFAALNPTTLALGGIGAIILIIGLVIALLSFKKSAKKARERKEEIPPEPSAPPIEPTTVQQPRMLTTQALKTQLRSDRSLLAVISYVIIAEFGIFSSKTISAPSVEVGMMFAGIFFIGAFIFIKTSYANYLKGIAHLMVASLFAVGLSLLLGHFWNSIPLETLLSETYFQTEALVAFITGIAVSLLMGSRG